MNSKIPKLARQEFQYNIPKIVASCNDELKIYASAGAVSSEFITISNEEKTSISGYAVSENPFIEIPEPKFSGITNNIEIKVDCTTLKKGDTLVGNVHVFSECGNITIHVLVKVKAGLNLGTEVKIFDSMDDFTKSVIDNPSKITKLFKGENFEKNIVGDDERKKMIYKGLKKNKSVRVAMEEYLVSTGAKQEIHLSADENVKKISIAFAAWKQQITVKKNTWGFAAYNVETASKFITLDTSRFTTDDFKDDTFEIAFNLDPGYLKEGVNYGDIVISNTIDKLVISIEVAPDDEKKIDFENAIKAQKLKINAADLIMDYLLGRIDFDEYVKNSNGLSTRVGLNEEGKTIAKYFELHIASKYNNYTELKKAMKDFEAKSDTLYDSDLDRYAILNYIFAKCRIPESEINSNDITLRSEDYIKNLESCLKAETHSWLVPALISLSNTNVDSETLYNEMLKFLKAGEFNQILCYSMIKLMKRNMPVFSSMEREMEFCLHWGIKTGYITEEIAERYAYFTSYRRGFSQLVLDDMIALYEIFGKDEFLSAICSMLIKAQRNDTCYHKWYELGIRRELKLTGLYEYYMYSFDQKKKLKDIPENVLEYFIYDTSLKASRRAALYSFIVANKDKSPEIYRAYRDKMKSFTIDQLANEQKSMHMALLYEEFISSDLIDTETSTLLSQVLFSHEVECFNPSIVRIIVRNTGFSEEEVHPLVQGRAFVNIYNEDAVVFLEDKNGNRYVSSVEYSMKKIMHSEVFVSKCYEYNKRNPGILINMYLKKNFRGENENARLQLLRSLYSLKGLDKDFKKKVYVELICECHSCYENDELDKLLKNLKWENVEIADYPKVIEICINRNSMTKACEGIKKLSLENMSIKDLYLAMPQFISSRDKTDIRFSELAAFHLFKKGKYDENILKLLCEKFDGAIHDMTQIFRLANNNNVDSMKIDERIMEKAILTNEIIPEVYDVFETYFQKDYVNRTIVVAFLNLISYRYVIKGHELPTQILPILIKKSKEENLVCMQIAALKAMSKMENPKEYQQYIEFYTEKLAEKGLWFNFFNVFAEEFDMKIPANDYKMVEIISDPKDVININYCYKEDKVMGEDKTELMQDMYEGIFVKKFLIFEGDSVDYRIIKEIPEISDGKILKAGTLKRTYGEKDSNSSYDLQMINSIIKAYELGKADEFLKNLNEYAYKKSIVESYEGYLNGR